MALIIWGDKYYVNIKVLDDLHKTLVNLATELHDAFETGRHRNVLAEMLAGLIQCANTLFVCEEELMNQYRYPGYEYHMQEHRLFIVQMCELQKNYVAGMRVLNQHSEVVPVSRTVWRR